VPAWAERPLRAGAAAAVAVAAVAMLLVLAGLVRHEATARALLRQPGGGVPAALGIAALCVLLLPNAAAATLGYVAGPGFALGTGSSVTVIGSHVGAVPTLPLLAAVPTGGTSHVGLLAMAVAGALAAVAAGRVLGPSSSTNAGHQLADAAGAGAVAGLIAAVAVALGGGPAGPGRMSAVGASPWQVGLALAGEVAVLAGIGALVTCWWAGRRATP